MGKVGVACCLIKGPQPSAEACPCADALQVPAPRDKQKKKKEKPCEFRSDPPIWRTLGTVRVTLESLLATEDLVATVCDFGILITEQPLQLPGLEEKVRSVSQGRVVRQCCQGQAVLQAEVQPPIPPIHPSVLRSIKWG